MPKSNNPYSRRLRELADELIYFREENDWQWKSMMSQKTVDDVAYSLHDLADSLDVMWPVLVEERQTA